MWNGNVDNYGDSGGQKSLFDYCKIIFGTVWSVKDFLGNLLYGDTRIVAKESVNVRNTDQIQKDLIWSELVLQGTFTN